MSLDRKTITVAEAAKLLGVHHRTVRKHVKDGQLPALQLGRKILILLEPLEQMLRGPIAQA